MSFNNLMNNKNAPLSDKDSAGLSFLLEKCNNSELFQYLKKKVEEYETVEQDVDGNDEECESDEEKEKNWHKLEKMKQDIYDLKNKTSHLGDFSEKWNYILNEIETAQQMIEKEYDEDLDLI